MSSLRKNTYKYIKIGDLIGIKCFFCDTISYNSRDVENKICPKCKVHHENSILQLHQSRTPTLNSNSSRSN